MMKLIRIIVIGVFALCSTYLSNGQIFVSAAATGVNDGTSWEDAYTQLSDAIDHSSEGDEIWVAEGTYLPGGLGSYRDTFFYLNHNVKLYGGFRGTETALNERPAYQDAPTILSGDVEGNDAPGNFEDFRDDNCLHIMFLDTNVTNDFIFDGFFVQNGHTEDASGSGNNRRAGGILTYGAPIIQNCTFRQNFGHFASAVYPRGMEATGFRVRNCLFEENFAGFGGAMYVVSLVGGKISDCQFLGNSSSSSGGAIYMSSCIDTIENCLFENNEVGPDSRAGALYINESSVLVHASTFATNLAITRTAGGAHITSDEDPSFVRFTECSFEGNESRWGAGLTVYNERTEVHASQCQFRLNETETAGGAVSVGFAGSLTLENCTFEENKSRGSGGAIFMQNDSSQLGLANTLLSQNQADNSGGAIHTTAGVIMQIEECEFESNIAAIGTSGGFGGAISLSEDSLNVAQLDISRSIFIGNGASDQGGAMSLVNVDSRITNCWFAFNYTGPSGIAGAISFNASGEGEVELATLSLLNNTFTNNEGNLAGGIVGWTGDSGSAVIEMQNNIFYHPGFDEFAIEDGEPEFISLGGNLSIASNVATYLSSTSDILGQNPLFMDESNLDFRLTANSPCIDQGINLNAPEIDLTGEMRDDSVDIGCYEYIPSNQSLRRPIEKQQLRVYPSVTTDHIHIEVPSLRHTNEAQLSIYDLSGNVLWKELLLTGTQVYTHRIGVDQLPSGYYLIQLEAKHQLLSNSFIKP